MGKNFVIAALIATCIVLCAVIVKIENQRYALQVGLCKDKSNPLMVDMKCLANIETRTSWVWHLYYAIKD
jgi:hypothetical protein